MKDEFYSRISTLSYSKICELQEQQRSVELNNVLDGFSSEFYTILVYDDKILDEYTLIYIGNNNGIRGLAFKSGRKLKDRDIYTFHFAQTIETEFPEKNALLIFNTFQSQLKSVYETLGILCIPEYIANLGKDLTFLLPSKKTEVDTILQINLLDFYQSFFNRKNKIDDKDDFDKIYLMYDQKESYFKIGKTKKKLKIRRKGVSEATLRALNPMIEVITAWKAPKELEAELHSIYKLKRKRGEWFDLRAIDLKNINEMTSQYEMIDISETRANKQYNQ